MNPSNLKKKKKKRRSHNAKKQLSSRRKDAAVALLVKEQKLEETALEKFKESLLWRMTLCCDMATVIQKWWVHRLSLAIARQDSTGIEQMKVECFDPKAIQTVVRRNKEVERQRMEEHRISPVATMVIPSSVPLGCDKIPLGGVIRTAVRPPPSSGILNINLRKEERERKELTLLEADIFISNTRFGDQRFSLFKEKKQIENNSAIKIQSMFRRNIARDRMEAMVLERQDRYFKLCPTKFEGHPVETPI